MFLLAVLKSPLDAVTSYDPAGSRGASYLPASSVTTVRAAPVSVLVIRMVAYGMALLVASVTLPEIEASPWPRTTDAPTKDRNEMSRLACSVAAIFEPRLKRSRVNIGFLLAASSEGPSRQL